MQHLANLSLLVILMALPVNAESRLPAGLVRALYGFSPTLTPFDGKGPQDAVAELRRLGCNAFFSGAEHTDLYRHFNENGIATYHEITIFASKKLYQERADLRPIRADGSEQPPRGWYYGLCPNNPELRQQKLERIKGLFSRPEVQGVWLDFIRYPVRWEVPDPWTDDTCFCDTCLEAFLQHTHGDFAIPAELTERPEIAEWILKEHLPSWIDFKCASIERFVADAAKVRDDVRPDGVLGIFTIPWYLSDFDGAIHRTVAQDFSRIGPHVDVFSPMVYHLLCGRPDAWVGEYTEWLKDLTQVPVWPIVQAMNEPGELSAESFERVTVEGAEASGTGVIIFTAGHVDKEKRWDQVRDAFSRLQENQ